VITPLRRARCTRPRIRARMRSSADTTTQRYSGHVQGTVGAAQSSPGACVSGYVRDHHLMPDTRRLCRPVPQSPSPGCHQSRAT
jgi:hypothetical protein